MSIPVQPPQRQWWRHGVCYQIWPTSFATSSDRKAGEGISLTGTSGTLKGVISKLDYIKTLGASYIWISPCYASPLKDQGYDISDYEDIHPSFGTVGDIERLIEQLHNRDMRLVLDLVINHTSDQHNWFKESCKSRNGQFSNYYHWHDPRFTRSKLNGGLVRHPPNQWASWFGGSAWTWCPTRQQYYLHLFLDSMPDVNWEHQNVRDAIFASSMEFWLKKGVDGFRLDACGLYSKTFPDAANAETAGAFTEDEIRSATPVEQAGEEDQEPYIFDLKAYAGGPRLHEFMRELRAKTTAQFGDQIMFVAENTPPSYAEAVRSLDPAFREEDMYFDFSLQTLSSWRNEAPDGPLAWDQSTMSNVQQARMHSIDSLRLGRRAHPVSDLHIADGERTPTAPLPLAYLRQALMITQSYITNHNRWCTIWFENHDFPRSISRFGHQGEDSSLRLMSAKLLALMQATLSGSLFVYQGQEIGMANIPTTGSQQWDIADLRDVWFRRQIQAVLDKYEGRSDEEARIAREKAWGTFNVSGRDHARTPMQWTDDKNVGFCPDNEQTWMRINKTKGDGISVSEQNGKAGSLLEFWRQALKVRKEYEDVLCYGRTKFVDNTNESVFSYVKESFDGKLKLLVMMNFSDKSSELPDYSSELEGDAYVHFDHVILGNGGQDRVGELDAWEGRVHRIK